MAEIISLEPIARQSFFITLDDIQFEFILNYNSRTPSLSLSILQDDNIITTGLFLAPGVNIIKNYDIRLGGLYVQASSPDISFATIYNLQEIDLIYLTKDEVA